VFNGQAFLWNTIFSLTFLNHPMISGLPPRCCYAICASNKIRSLITMAKSAKGKDDDGYRAEFIRLAESTKNLMKSNEVVAAK
jgi:hypothetical protein